MTSSARSIVVCVGGLPRRSGNAKTVVIVVSAVLLAMLGIAGACTMTISTWWNRPWLQSIVPPSKTDHAQMVNSVAFSPDGKLIVSGSSDNTIKVWDALSGQQTVAVASDPFHVNSVAISADGKRILAGGQWHKNNTEAGVIKIFDSGTGKEIISIDHPKQITSAAFSPDGKHVAAAEYGDAVLVWEARSGQRTLRIPNAFSCVAYSPDGKRIVSAGSNKTAIVWDAENGKETLSLVGHKESVVSVAFRADGKRIVSAEQGPDIKIWNADSGEELLTLHGHQGRVKCVAFSPDGKYVVSGSTTAEDKQTGTRPGEIKVWDAETGKEILNLQGLRGAVHNVQYRPDGKQIVSAGGGHGPERRVLGSFVPWAEIKIWDAATGKEILTLGKQ